MDNRNKKEEGKSFANDLARITMNLIKAKGEETAQMFSDPIDELEKSKMKSSVLKPGETATEFSLKNALGEIVVLSNVLQNGPVILTWYRGKWCPYCNLALNYMQLYLDQFKEAGGNLIAITPERPDESLSTKERHGLKFEILTDEDNSVARNYGGVHDLRDHIKGFYHEKESGNHYQPNEQVFPVPATYVIDQNLIVRYAFVEADYRLRADPEDILQILIELKTELK